MKIKPIALSVAYGLLAGSAPAATLVSLSTFGGGDGWRAPNEIIAGDTAGTATGSNFNYLGTGSLERGMAYNPVTGNLILVSRSTAGNGLRILSGTTGADLGFLNQGSGVISGGTFTTSTVGVSTDGNIYVANLTTNASTSNFKVYQWTSEAAATPSTFFNGAIAGGAPRLGDALDVFGPSSSVSLVTGAGTGSTTGGYAVITSSGVTRIDTFTPAASLGDFRLGITYTANGNSIWGKQTGASAVAAPLRESTFSGTTGTLTGSATLTSGGEAAMDYTVINSVPYLATLDINSSLVRVYNVSDPALPVLLTSLTTTSGSLASNGNGTGSIKWGAISGDSATLYAMASNQGIQAFTFAIPEPSSTLLGLAGVGLLLRRRRK